jgi:hypothetical protein
MVRKNIHSKYGLNNITGAGKKKPITPNKTTQTGINLENNSKIFFIKDSRIINQKSILSLSVKSDNFLP